MLASVASTDMAFYHLAAKLWHNTYKDTQASVVSHKAKNCQGMTTKETLGEVTGQVELSLSRGCCYLGRRGNPPEHLVECPLSGARARKAWPCDTSAGGAASQIYLGNHSEPWASPNPAGESSAFLPVIASRFITQGVNENTDFFSQSTKTWGRVLKCHHKYPPLPICIYVFKHGDWDRTLFPVAV